LSFPKSIFDKIKGLIYVTEVLKGFVPQRPLYEKKPHKIPTPEFFVIYNGKDKAPDKEVYRLSDTFIAPAEAPSLELVVTVINVAKGHNEGLLLRCTPLSDYSSFVSLVNDGIATGLALDAALDGAIHYCIQHDIMRVYLQEESAEVKRMLITEWNEDEYREVIRDEAREEGLAEGIAEGLAEGIAQGIAQGIEQGAVREKTATARRMKEYGDPADKIADITGLSPDEISLI